MQATERLFDIEEKFGQQLQALVPLDLDGETLRLILYLKDGANLRVTEQWQGKTLQRYSYYWLNAANELIIGWDNSPHHTRLENFPHHKHIGSPENIQPSFETNLEAVMVVIANEIQTPF